MTFSCNQVIRCRRGCTVLQTAVYCAAVYSTAVYCAAVISSFPLQLESNHELGGQQSPAAGAGAGVTCTYLIDSVPAPQQQQSWALHLYNYNDRCPRREARPGCDAVNGRGSGAVIADNDQQVCHRRIPRTPTPPSTPANNQLSTINCRTVNEGPLQCPEKAPISIRTFSQLKAPIIACLIKTLC